MHNYNNASSTNFLFILFYFIKNFLILSVDRLNGTEMILFPQ